jgi:hypothetical protein
MARRRKNGADDQPLPIDGGEDAPQEQSNSAARADTIREAARWLRDREAEVASLREDIAGYKKTHIQGDLGFKLSDWNTLYRLYGLEGDDRDKLIDTIREGFAALGVGEQLDWIKEAERADRGTKPNGAAPADGGWSLDKARINENITAPRPPRGNRRAERLTGDSADIARATTQPTADANPIARQTGYTDGFAGVRDHAAQWSAGFVGHSDYELGWGEGQVARVEQTDISEA